MITNHVFLPIDKDKRYVGKMTVGQELMKMTGLRLFHDHMTIESILEMRSSKTHIDLVFTKKEYHRKGIARAIFHYLLDDILAVHPVSGSALHRRSLPGPGPGR